MVVRAPVRSAMKRCASSGMLWSSSGYTNQDGTVFRAVRRSLHSAPWCSAAMASWIDRDRHAVPLTIRSEPITPSSSAA